MSVSIASSSNPDPVKAAQEIFSGCSAQETRVVIFFASAMYNPEIISAEMKKVFPSACVMGCSTSGEIISGKMLKKSVVAMAFPKDIIGEFFVDLIPMHDLSKATSVMRSLSGKVGKTPIQLDPNEYLGIILMDGLSCGEEALMEKLGDLTNISIIGGSAGDDLAFAKTFVYLEGKAYNDMAILAIIKPEARFEMVKTQSFSGTGIQLTPTRVEESTRTVLEFNGKPAAVAYAEAVQVPLDQVSTRFMTNPVGLIADGTPYVRSPQRIDGNAMIFYCQIREGIDLELLTSTDIIADTKKSLDDVKSKVGTIHCLINFHCILRTLELEQKGITVNYGELFTNIPTIGFSTYGEAYIGHINQTSTMLVFY